MELKLKVIKIGSSNGVIIPKVILGALNIKEGQTIKVSISDVNEK